VVKVARKRRRQLRPWWSRCSGRSSRSRPGANLI